MAKGGKRDGAGRKKIGEPINIRVEKSILSEIDNKIKGKTRAERIRKCIYSGLQCIAESEEHYE